MKRVLVSAIVATLAVVGCSNADTASSAAWYDSRSKDGPDALATGTLEEIDGCIYLISVDDGGRYLPVFRGRPTWTPEGALRTDTDTYVLGEVVELGGGEVSPSVDPGLKTTIPDTCDLGLTRWTVSG